LKEQRETRKLEPLIRWLKNNTGTPINQSTHNSNTRADAHEIWPRETRLRQKT
jgi:hypothetical protein